MIDIICLDESHYDRMGIYRIWFGWKFYIGATADTTTRLKGHKSAIEKGFSGYRRGQNALTKIVDHLTANSFIKTAFFELLEPCDREIDLVDAEHDWLCNFVNDPNCLNYKFHVSRKIGNIIVVPNGEIRIKVGGKYVHP